MIKFRPVSDFEIGATLEIIDIGNRSSWHSKKEFLIGEQVIRSENGNLTPLDKSRDKDWFDNGISAEIGIYICSGKFKILKP